MTCDLVVTAAVDILPVTAMYAYMPLSLNSKNTAFCMCIYTVVLRLFDYDRFVWLVKLKIFKKCKKICIQVHQTQIWDMLETFFLVQ